MKNLLLTAACLLLVVNISFGGHNRCSFKGFDRFNRDFCSVDIFVDNSDTLAGFQIPFSFENEYADLICDSVSFVGSRCGNFDMLHSEIDNESKTVFIMGIYQTNPAVDKQPLMPGRGIVAKVYFTVNSVNENVKKRDKRKIRFTEKRMQKSNRDIPFSFWTVDGENVESVFENNAIDIEEEE